MSSLFFHKSRRSGDDPVNRARAVWKLRALKFNMAAAMNFFIPNVEDFLKLFCLCSAKATHCLELRGGDQAVFLSRRLEQYEQTYVSTPNAGKHILAMRQSDMMLSSL